MTAKASYNRHFAALSALFVMGEAVIMLPDSSADEYTGICFTIAVLSALPLYFLSSFLLRRLFFAYDTGGRFSKAGFMLFITAIAFYAFENAGKAFVCFINYAEKIILPDTENFFIAAVFLAAAVLLFFKPKEVILKLSVILFAVCVSAVLIFFFLTAKDFCLTNLSVNKLPSLKVLCDGLPNYILRLSLPTVLVSASDAAFFKGAHKQAGFAGICIGLSAVTLGMLDCILLFGIPLSERLAFPLSAAVSTVTVGPLFSRMDGIIYCVFFVTALIKTVWCMKISFSFLRMLLPNKES